MIGIDLNKPIIYKHSSLRFFEKDEFHIDRHCDDDVLLLVFDGVLKFSENDVFYEVSAGNYHIQKHNTFQKGVMPSDSPKYLYVHFYADWSNSDDVLPFYGAFDYQKLKGTMEKLDKMAHNNYTFTEQTAEFLSILSSLYRESEPNTIASQITQYISENISGQITLDSLAACFSFSKNHIINIFKKQFGVTPIEYINRQKIQKAKHLLEATSA